VVGSLVGSAVGSPVGSAVGSPVGSAVGSPVGSLVGSPVGSLVGSPVGSVVGSPVGSLVGSPVGSLVGSPVGSLVGSPVGSVVGSPVGSLVGSPVGSLVGSPVGSLVGSPVGSLVGSPVGSVVGSDVGSVVGSAVGSGVAQMPGVHSVTPAKNTYPPASSHHARSMPGSVSGPKHPASVALMQHTPPHSYSSSIVGTHTPVAALQRPTSHTFNGLSMIEQSISSGSVHNPVDSLPMFGSVCGSQYDMVQLLLAANNAMHVVFPSTAGSQHRFDSATTTHVPLPCVALYSAHSQRVHGLAYPFSASQSAAV
jgi:outer membrane lipoprotein SlyB